MKTKAPVPLNRIKDIIDLMQRRQTGILDIVEIKHGHFALIYFFLIKGNIFFLQPDFGDEEPTGLCEMRGPHGSSELILLKDMKKPFRLEFRAFSEEEVQLNKDSWQRAFFGTKRRRKIADQDIRMIGLTVQQMQLLLQPLRSKVKLVLG